MGNPKWKPGVSGNPGGGPGRLRGKGVVDYIGKTTNDGVLLAQKMLRIANGEDKRATVAHQLKAIEWLADRYMGKAVDVSLTGDLADESNPLKDLKPEELKAVILAAVRNRSTAKPPAASPPAENAKPDATQQPPAPTSTQTPENT